MVDCCFYYVSASVTCNAPFDLLLSQIVCLNISVNTNEVAADGHAYVYGSVTAV